jgi:hypothetical protein
MVGLAEELRQGVETCEMALSGEVLPHQVDAWKLWETLAASSDRLTEPEEFLLYASLMRMIVATVRLQCRWLRYEADELYVDSDMAREKLNSLSMRILNSLFSKCFHPLVEVEQLTTQALQMGKEHWDELTGDGADDEVSSDQFLSYGRGSEAEKVAVERVPFSELLDGLEEEFLAGVDGSETPYHDFISRGGSAGFPEMVTRAYLGSFLVSLGRLNLVARGSDLKLSRGVEGLRDTVQSHAVILRKPGGDREDAVQG